MSRKFATQGRCLVVLLSKRAMTWRDAPGWSEYEVSDVGLVRRKATGYVLTTFVNVGGYMTYRLSERGIARTVYAHQLVAAAFIGTRPEGQQVRHLDGDRLNNTPENLAYGTALENCLDKHRHGTVLAGERHPMAVLSDEECLSAIRRAMKTSMKKEAGELGISPSTLSMIKRGVNRPYLYESVKSIVCEATA